MSNNIEGNLPKIVVPVHLGGASCDMESIFKLSQEYSSYVMENILFKISFPAEFHSQTAAEAAVRLHPIVKDRLADIKEIKIKTHESAIRIISKVGPLNNPADRDHCLQYMIAVPLMLGTLTADHYEDDFHRDNPIIDTLREKMTVVEEPRFTNEYLEPNKRSIANSLQVFFTDGTATEEIEINYPVGHRRRREEGIPLLEKKFKTNLLTVFKKDRCEDIFNLCKDQKQLENTYVNDFMDLFIP